MAFTGVTRRIEPLDLLAYRQISSVCFEYDFTYDKDAQAFYEEGLAKQATSNEISERYFMDKYVAAYEGKVVAGLAPYPFKVAFDGNVVRMSGISQVCSSPTSRRLGAVRAMFEHMLRDEREAGAEWSALFPFSQAYYEKFGYAMSECNAEWSFALRYIAVTEDKGHTFTMHEGGTDNIDGFVKAYESQPQYNLLIQRELCSHNKVAYANPYSANSFAYLCRDKDGAPRGYVVWHKERENDIAVMAVGELVFDNIETLRAIMNFIATFAADYTCVRFEAPMHLNLELLCKDMTGAHGQMTRKVNPVGMVRVVHLENALRAAKVLGTGGASLRVEDPVFGTTNLGLTWRDGVLTDIGGTNTAPDAVLGVGAFSQLLLGRFDADNFPFIANADIINADKLAGLFYKKRIHTKNTF